MTKVELIASQIADEKKAILELEKGILECAKKFYFSNKKREADISKLIDLINEHQEEVRILHRSLTAEFWKADI